MTISSATLLATCIPRDLAGNEMLQFEHLVTGKRRIARNASLYLKHDSLIMLYVVRFGQFKVIGGDLIRETRVAGFHTPGDLMGLDAIESGQHQFRVVALENSEVCEIPYKAIVKMMSVEPPLQRQLLHVMGGALNNEFNRSFLLATMSLDVRFASFLLSLASKSARQGYSDKSFKLTMSRGDIGSYLGTTIESISRLITRFNEQGAVSIVGRTVELLDRPYLRALLTGI